MMMSLCSAIEIHLFTISVSSSFPIQRSMFDVLFLSLPGQRQLSAYGVDPQQAAPSFTLTASTFSSK